VHVAIIAMVLRAMQFVSNGSLVSRSRDVTDGMPWNTASSKTRTSLLVLFYATF
jgi:hypothetical protein